MEQERVAKFNESQTRAARERIRQKLAGGVPPSLAEEDDPYAPTTDEDESESAPPSSSAAAERPRTPLLLDTVRPRGRSPARTPARLDRATTVSDDDDNDDDEQQQHRSEQQADRSSPPPLRGRRRQPSSAAPPAPPPRRAAALLADPPDGGSGADDDINEPGGGSSRNGLARARAASRGPLSSSTLARLQAVRSRSFDGPSGSLSRSGGPSSPGRPSSPGSASSPVVSRFREQRRLRQSASGLQQQPLLSDEQQQQQEGDADEGEQQLLLELEPILKKVLDDQRLRAEGGEPGDGAAGGDDERAWDMRSTEWPDWDAILAEDEARLYVYTPDAPLALQEFEGQPFQPRFLSEEGFYVGKKPYVPLPMQNKMEQRLFREYKAPGRQQLGIKAWFGLDGRMNHEADPLKPTFERPHEWWDPNALYLQLRYVYPAKNTIGLNEISFAQRYELEIDVDSVVFRDHALFGREDLLASQLQLLYEQYQERKRLNLAEYYFERLVTFEDRLAELKAKPPPTPSRQRPGSAALLSSSQTLRRYEERRQTMAQEVAEQTAKVGAQMSRLRQQIRQTRILRDTEEATDLMLAKKMLVFWKELKALRRQQGYQTTHVRLKMGMTETDEQTDLARLEFQLKSELDELQEDHQARFAEELKEYHARLKQYEAAKYQRDTLIAQKRYLREQLSAARRQMDSDDEASANQEDEDEEGEEDYDKLFPLDPPPTIPQYEEFDVSKAKKAILKRYKETKRKPGTAIMEPFVFSEGNEADEEGGEEKQQQQQQQLGFDEQQRRFEIGRRLVYCRLVVNGRVVTQSDAQPLSLAFAATFGQIFTVQLARWPDSIRLQICQTLRGGNSGNDVVLAEVPLRIPVTDVIPMHEDFAFQGTVPFKPLWQQEQDEAKPEAGDDDSTRHYYSGSVRVMVSWSHDEAGNVQSPPIPSGVRKARLDTLGPQISDPSARKFREWLSKLGNDPNDPRNSNIQVLLRGKANAEFSASEIFSTTRHEIELAFLEDVDEPVPEPETQRQKLLKLRNAKKVERAAVPALDDEINEAMFKPAAIAPTDDALPAIKAQTNRAFLREVRQAQVQRLKMKQKQRELRFEDVFGTFDYFQFSDPTKAIRKLFRPRRALNPTRHERKAVNASKAPPEGGCNILIQVVRASNMPQRKAHLLQRSSKKKGPGGDQDDVPSRRRRDRGLGGLSNESNDDETSEGVTPFVQVNFMQHERRTVTSQGTDPQWHDLLTIPFEPPGGDFSEKNLKVISETIYFNVFDEITINLPTDDRDPTEQRFKRERRWLGGFTLPFSTVYESVKVEGTFELRKPPISLSHETHTHPLSGGRKVAAAGGAPQASDKTTLVLFATIDPPLSSGVPPADEPVPSKEEADFVRYATAWVDSTRRLAQCAQRTVQAMAINLSGKSVSLVRYIRPQPPPPGIDSVEAAVRFVSLVPFLEDSVTFIGRSNVWSTSKQFLQMRAGDWEEHAILLCNYLLFMKKSAYVMLGYGVDGDCAYTLVEGNDGQMTVINPVSGESWLQNDTLCPMRRVGTIFNDQNIWANVSTREEIWRVKFKLNAPKHWRKFFDVRFPYRQLSSVQDESILYGETSEKYVKTIEAEIEKAVTDAIRGWRKRFVSRWNRNCNRLLKQMLVRCEDWAIFRDIDPIDAQCHNELARLVSAYDINGMPINCTYTDAQEIVDRLKATSIHDNNDPLTEFSLAVHVVPYANRVCSVWLFVCSLVPKR